MWPVSQQKRIHWADTIIKKKKKKHEKKNFPFDCINYWLRFVVSTFYLSHGPIKLKWCVHAIGWGAIRQIFLIDCAILLAFDSEIQQRSNHLINWCTHCHITSWLDLVKFTVCVEWFSAVGHDEHQPFSQLAYGFHAQYFNLYLSGWVVNLCRTWKLCRRSHFKRSNNFTVHTWICQYGFPFASGIE